MFFEAPPPAPGPRDGGGAAIKPRRASAASAPAAAEAWCDQRVTAGIKRIGQGESGSARAQRPNRAA